MNLRNNLRNGEYKALASLGAPIVVGQLGNVVLGFADTLMVGHHSMTELAAASFVNTMFLLVIVFSAGFSLGITPIVGSLFGRGKHSEIGSTMRDGLVANLLLSAVMAVLSIIFCLNIHRFGQPEELLPLMRPYLWVNIASLPFICCFNAMKQFFDGITDTKMPMYVILTGNMLNIFGNWVLIYGELGMPELGLFGAGLSTAFSRVFMAVALLLVFFSASRYREFRAGFIASRTSAAGMKRISAMGLPVAVQLGIETSSFSISTIFVGWIGTVALAAHQVVITLSQFLYLVSSGMAAAIAVRVSYFNGQNDYPAVRNTVSVGLRLVLTIAFVLSMPVLFVRNSVCLWFTDDVAASILVAQTIIPLIAYQVGDAVQYTYANALRGISYVRPIMLLAFIAYFLVSIPLSWFLGIYLGWGLPGIWWAYPVSLFFAGVLYRRCFFKRLKGLE